MRQKSVQPISKHLYKSDMKLSRLSNVMHTQPYHHKVVSLNWRCFIFIMLISIGIGYGVFQAVFKGECREQRLWLPSFYLPRTSCSIISIQCIDDECETMVIPCDPI